MVPAWAAAAEPAAEGTAVYRSAVVGTVVGYGDPRSYTNKRSIRWVELSVQVAGEDGGPVVSERIAYQLAAVVPFALSACGGKPVGTDQARVVLERLLPVGTRVLAVPPYDGDEVFVGLERFLHVLPVEGAVPAVAPPAGSVNEALVASGYWVPDVYTSDQAFEAERVGVSSELESAGKVTARAPVKYKVAYTVAAPPLRDYLARIVAAANAALRDTAPGRECRSRYEAFVAYSVRRAKAQAVQEEKERKAYLAWLARSSGGCRDGDGDGVCYED